MEKKKKIIKKSIPKPAQKASPLEYIPGLKKPEEFKQFGLYMALPSEERKTLFGISSERQFSAKFKVHHKTLAEWKMRKELWEIRDQYLIVFKKYTSQVIDSLGKRAAKSGEAFHSLSFLKVVEGFTEKTGLDITSKNKKVSGFKITIVNAKGTPTIHRYSGSGGSK